MNLITISEQESREENQYENSMLKSDMSDMDIFNKSNLN